MKTLVTGSGGLMGQALKDMAPEQHEFFFAERKHADITKEEDVKNLYESVKPDYVIHAAARVGGIGCNLAHPYELYRDNILMNTHMIDYAVRFKVKKFIAFSSMCAMPVISKTITEDDMHDGPIYEANWSYGWSKRMIDVQIQALSKQFGISGYCSLILGNLFGPNDMYNLKDAHVIPALIHKIFLAKRSNDTLKVWGDGSSQREFIYSQDAARIIFKLLEMEVPKRLIVSGDEQISIADVVYKLCDAANFPREKVEWDTSKPNGQKARPTDTSLLKSLVGDQGYTDMGEALKVSYQWFEDNYPNVRL